MARFIHVPVSPMLVINPNKQAHEAHLDDEGKPMPSVSAREVFTLVFRDQRFVEALGMFESYDLRKRLTTKTGTIEVSDSEHEILKKVITRPQVMNALWLVSPEIVEFLRSVCNAPDKEPSPQVVAG